MKNWYATLIDKAKQSYSQLVIVKDLDQLGSDKSLQQELEKYFAIISFQGELSLRQFIRQHQTQHILILIQREETFLPYDVESCADFLSWKLTDVFPRLDSRALKKYESEHYQSIFDTYQLMEDKMSFLDEQQTQLLIEEWVRLRKVTARAKIYSGLTDTNKNDQRELNENNTENSCQRLIHQIQQLLLQDSINWGDIAQKYGELEVLHPMEMTNTQAYSDLEHKLDQHFLNFIFEGYDQLFFASYMNGPVTINQTMNYLSTLDSRRIALLCFDGMGLAEWLGLKKYLNVNQISDFKEQVTFALIPTLTAVSRTSLFSGEVALSKMVSETTGFYKAVERLFMDGKSKTKYLFKNTDGKWNPEYLAFEVLGIIFNLIDSVGHNTTLFTKSKKNMHRQLNELYNESQIARIISKLLSEGYKIFLTADHGTIWCCGNGVNSDKYLVEERARRALIYPNKKLAEEFASKNEVMVMQNQRIVGDKVLIFPRGREMFNTKDKLEISHGGTNIQEVIIPFVEVLP
ncbi:hypothetical protein A7D23_05595 [Dehalobacter sp. TeCB1]|nr:hypothetical protein A7D23_05595 [Dehalobacter sp. TeCB1]